MHRKISIALVLFFLASLVGIELKRQGIIPARLGGLIPDNHFYAVQVAFTVVLILEVVSLVFTLPCSFSRSVGMQFELLSLILMQNAFKSLSQFPEPVTLNGNEQAILHIISDGFGTLLIFENSSQHTKRFPQGNTKGVVFPGDNREEPVYRSGARADGSQTPSIFVPQAGQQECAIRLERILKPKRLMISVRQEGQEVFSPP